MQAAVLFAVSLSLAQPPAAPDAVRKVLDEQVVAWNRGDLEGFMVGYWKSPDLSFYSSRGQE